MGAQARGGGTSGAEAGPGGIACVRCATARGVAAGVAAGRVASTVTSTPQAESAVQGGGWSPSGALPLSGVSDEGGVTPW